MPAITKSSQCEIDVNKLFNRYKEVLFTFAQLGDQGQISYWADIFLIINRLFKSSLNKCSWGSVGEESTCNAGDPGHTGSIPGLGRSSGGGHGNPLQYSCLKNPVGRGAWWATVLRLAKSWTWLNN